MTTHLPFCVALPNLHLHLAYQQYALATHPLVITDGTRQHSRVLMACALARRTGIHVNQRLTTARQHHPSLQVVARDQLDLNAITQQLHTILRDHSPWIEGDGPQRWYGQFEALGLGFRHAPSIATALWRTVVRTTKLPCVVGAGSNRLVAMLAAHVAHSTDRSDLIVLPGQEAAFVAPLPLTWLPAITARQTHILHSVGFRTCDEIAALPRAQLVPLLGSATATIQHQARGEDTYTSVAATVIEQHTFAHPCADDTAIHTAIHVLTERAARRLRLQQTACGAVTLHLTWLDGHTTQYRTACVPRRDLDPDLVRATRTAATKLLMARTHAVHTIIVELADLGPQQATLFDEATDRGRQVQAAKDQVRARHGTGALQAAWLVPAPRRAA